MEEIKVEVKFQFPKLDLSEKEKEYLNDLIAEVLIKNGSSGILAALENYLGK